MKKPVNKFLAILFEILDNEELTIIKWTNTGFEIDNISKFKVNILPKYFKHIHYASFLRQTNKYGFQVKSVSNNQCLFIHKSICSENRVYKQQKKNLTLNFEQELAILKQQLENIKNQQGQLMKQMIISMKIMEKIVNHQMGLQNMIQSTIIGAAYFMEIIKTNSEKYRNCITGDLLQYQLSVAKYAFPTLFDPKSPALSECSTPLPFYFPIFQQDFT